MNPKIVFHYNKDDMNATKFAWVYLIEHGYCGIEHSYYGGYGHFLLSDNKQLLLSVLTVFQ